MNIQQVHPELRTALTRMPTMPFYSQLLLPIIRYLFKFVPLGKMADGVSSTDENLGNSKVRIYRPEGKLSGAGMIWIHGGGLLIGSLDMNDRECSLFAKTMGMVVVSVEYRLAPRYVFPAAIDDCENAWQWFQNNAGDLGVDPERIVIAGQSAGGGLAASLAQRLLDQGGIQPFAQALFAPMLDDRTATKHNLDALEHRAWNNKNNRAAWSWYLDQPAGAPNVPPYASAARRDNLTGLPATWMCIGDIDLFYDENCQYAARLKNDGVLCELEIVDGAPHGFEAFAPDSSVVRQLMQSNFAFLRRVLNIDAELSCL